MAKKKDEGELATKPEIELSREERALAKRAIMDCVGCGEPEAESRMQSMGSVNVKKIADLEAADKRVEIVTILFS